MFLNGSFWFFKRTMRDARQLHCCRQGECKLFHMEMTDRKDSQGRNACHQLGVISPEGWSASPLAERTSSVL